MTGQAFEDMQEQNMRLLQQLREKDDANFKLMSEVLHVKQNISLATVSFFFIIKRLLSEQHRNGLSAFHPVQKGYQKNQ